MSEPAAPETEQQATAAGPLPAEAAETSGGRPP